MGSPGGGSSMSESTVYPNYIRGQYRAWLNGSTDVEDGGTGAVTAVQGFNVAENILNASRDVGGSPYEFVQAQDPTEQLDAMKGTLETFTDAVNALAPGTDVAAAITAMKSEVDAHISTDTDIAASVSAAEAANLGQLARRLSEVSAGLFDIRAVQGTQFSFAMAEVQRDFSAQLTDLDKRLRIAGTNERNQALLHLTQMYLQQMGNQLQAKQAAHGLTVDLGKLEIIARNDQISQDLDWEVKDALWDLELGHYGGQMLSSIFGAATMPRPQTKGERLIATVTAAGSLALNVGGSMGPAAGAVAGLGYLGLNALANATDRG